MQRRIASPEFFPAELRTLFDELTGPGSDRWGLEAAILIARQRKRTRRSPTFAELFAAVLSHPDLSGKVADVDWATLSGFVYSFRHHVAVHWRRRGWIAWSNRPRSLHGGLAFSRASRSWHPRR